MADFSNLKVGDKVFICGINYKEVGAVEKVGKVHLTIKGRKYRISDGNPTGEWSYHSPFLRLFDESEWTEYRGEQRLKSMRRALSEFNWHGCTQELAEAAFALLPKKEGQ